MTPPLGDPLRQEFAPLVMAHHIVQCHRGRLVGRRPIRGQTEGSHGARVHDPLDPGGCRSTENVLGAIDVTPIELLRLPGIEPIVGGTVVDDLTVAQDILKTGRIAQIAGHHLDRAGQRGGEPPRIASQAE